MRERGSFAPLTMAGDTRKLAERTVAGLIAILESCANLFQPRECANYFEACRYDPAEILALNST